MTTADDTAESPAMGEADTIPAQAVAEDLERSLAALAEYFSNEANLKAATTRAANRIANASEEGTPCELPLDETRALDYMFRLSVLTGIEKQNT